MVVCCMNLRNLRGSSVKLRLDPVSLLQRAATHCVHSLLASQTPTLPASRRPASPALVFSCVSVFEPPSAQTLRHLVALQLPALITVQLR